jgi:hypothetical protein
VIEVSVGEQDGNRMQAVPGNDLVELSGDPDARVDDDALLAGSGRDHVAVRVGRVGRETRDEHGRELLWVVGADTPAYRERLRRILSQRRDCLP